MFSALARRFASVRAAPVRAFSEAAAAPAPASGERIKGTVKWFNATKGYGFIQQPGGQDLFVHFRDIEGTGFRTLMEGQAVEFSVASSPKGSNAVKVSPK